MPAEAGHEHLASELQQHEKNAARDTQQQHVRKARRARLVRREVEAIGPQLQRLDADQG